MTAVEEHHRRAMIWAEGPSVQAGSSPANITSETTASSPPPPTISAGIISPSPDPSAAATSPTPQTPVSAGIISPTLDPSAAATSPTPLTPVSAGIVSSSLDSSAAATSPTPLTDPSAAATSPTPLTVSAGNPAPASLANVTTLANDSNYAHHVNLNGISSHSLNVHHPTVPGFMYPASQAQIATHAATAEHSPMSKFLIATNSMYGWDDREVNNTLPILRQPDSFNDAGTHNWNFAPNSTFTFPNTYQSNQAIDMTASHYSPVLTMDGSMSLHHGLFSPEQVRIVCILMDEVLIAICLDYRYFIANDHVLAHHNSSSQHYHNRPWHSKSWYSCCSQSCIGTHYSVCVSCAG